MSNQAMKHTVILSALLARIISKGFKSMIKSYSYPPPAQEDLLK